MPGTVLITGCSSPQGIGFATARALAEAGFSVHATVRDRTHVEDLLEDMGSRLDVHDMDLLDPASVGAAVAAITGEGGRLDVLVNNAGYGLIGGVEQVELDRARANFETNFFGTVGLVQEVLPIMRRQGGGLIVNVSTVFAAALCPPALGYYIASKAALETVCQALAVEAAPWGVRVVNFQPGPVMTELEREWGARLVGDADPRPTLSDELYDWVLDDSAPAAQSPAEVAAALCEVVRSGGPHLAAQSGAAAEAHVATALRDPSRDAELGDLSAAFARTLAARGGRAR
ncbi:MAG TPA: SDR family oxidoreductase [Solirubrobacterales bacterium]|nr:SDR family oxidoreductase [Solirubrobacterales bacterium]